jgi:hypothetical protein
MKNLPIVSSEEEFAKLSFEEIERVIGHQFAEGERDLAYALWADDQTERIFTPIEGTSDFFIDLRPQH